MYRLARLLPLVVTVLLLAGGTTGLRALHCAVEHGGGSEPSHIDLVDGCCDVDARPDATHDSAHQGTLPGRDSPHCATCELLFGLALSRGSSIEVPAFHALVAVTDPALPERASAPLPPALTAARPPPMH